MPKYAENTTVSSELSRLEIERTLIKYGASSFMYASSEGKAMIAFKMYDRQIKFLLPLPPISDYKYTPSGRQERTANSQREAWEQACRQRWRALHLVIKAKLEAVECGISVFDDEFMANILLPNNQTVSDFMGPQIKDAYLTGTMPSLLPMLEG
ncbi:MAG: hypothetical protein WCS30_00170 [Selenomonadaceae bacterium]